MLELGLHIQHGRERDRGRGAEHTVELVQCETIPETEAAVGGVAGAHCGMGGCGHEYGIAGFPSHQRHG